jgi:uncharacterized protein YjaZ
MKLKNLLLLMLLALMVTFIGCNKGPEKLIVKTWKVTNVMTKGTYDDSTFQAIKADLMKAYMMFKDIKYTMTSDGNLIESGTYQFENKQLVVTTEKGMNMNAVVTKDNLTLETPDFICSLQPK